MIWFALAGPGIYHRARYDMEPSRESTDAASGLVDFPPKLRALEASPSKGFEPERLAVPVEHLGQSSGAPISDLR